MSIIRPPLEICNAEGLIAPVAGGPIPYLNISLCLFPDLSFYNALVTYDQVRIL